MIRIQTAPITDLASLRKALQSAIELELFTIPPYLTALYTLSGNSRAMIYARSIIEDIVEEEMLHMNLACNILNAIGGQPDITTKSAVPAYPNTLPMAIAGGVEVHIKRYSHELVKNVFMEIEKPEKPLELPIKPRFFATAAAGPKTIGEFYAMVRAEIVRQAAEDDIFSLGDPERQVTDFFSKEDVRVVDVATATTAIDTIVQQGEGTPKGPTDLQDDIAHYYRFQELEKGMKLVQDPNSEFGYSFDPTQPITIDDKNDVIQMVDDPQTIEIDKGDTDARDLADKCDNEYSSILKSLHAGFNGDKAQLGFIDLIMVGFGATIRDLLNVKLQHGPHAGLHAGPRFKYVP